VEFAANLLLCAVLIEYHRSLAALHLERPLEALLLVHTTAAIIVVFVKDM
jgi:hypothetical protein